MGRDTIERKAARAVIRIDEKVSEVMAKTNQLWGAPRIHGELLKLGIS
jgi:hypothetical protein